MKRLLLLGTIAAMALTTTGQAQSLEQTNTGSRRVVTKHSTERATVVPSTNRRVVTRYRNVVPSTNRRVVTRYSNGGRYYYSGGRYYSSYSPYYGGYSPYYYGGPSISVGFGGYSGYPGYGYGYGYPYNYGYGYNYPSDYYGAYPSGYRTTTYTTSRYGDLAYDDNIVVAVQERLRRAGYYLGPIDGVAGPGTRSAIARWEGNHGMIADGRIDNQTLRSLGI